CTSGIVAAAYW
nr:immunoglobulin heavy chain junction region [Macaca mulatta]MOX67797.1 immunoglobulin heavy chain junction region [Macaca mulatta]